MFRNGKILGYYIGYKKNDTKAPFTYIAKSSLDNFCFLENLEKFTYYSVHVLAFNKKGPGPQSEDEVVLTLEDGNVCYNFFHLRLHALEPMIIKDYILYMKFLY